MSITTVLYCKQQELQIRRADFAGFYFALTFSALTFFVLYAQLEMDGVRVDLPELEGIIIVNINSWCGGCPIWTTEQIIGSTEKPPPSPCLTASSSSDSLSSLLADRQKAMTSGSPTSASFVNEPSASSNRFAAPATLDDPSDSDIASTGSTQQLLQETSSTATTSVPLAQPQQDPLTPTQNGTTSTTYGSSRYVSFLSCFSCWFWIVIFTVWVISPIL